jgi:hypothetical protein
MLLNQETVEVNDRILLESIKSDIQSQLNEIGVTTSRINVEMNSKNISLNISIRRLSHKIRHPQFNANS